MRKNILRQLLGLLFLDKKIISDYLLSAKCATRFPPNHLGRFKFLHLSLLITLHPNDFEYIINRIYQV